MYLRISTKKQNGKVSRFVQLARLIRRKLVGSSWSWERAIERLRGIKTFVIKSGATEKRGITSPDREEKAICKQLNLLSHSINI